MADGSVTPGVLRRMLAGGSPEAQTRRATATGLLKRAVVLAAQDAVGLVVTPRQAREDRASLDDLVEKLPEHALLSILEQDGEPRGLAVLDAQSLAALIEVQTTGRVVPREAPGRVPTRTDALLAAGFLDRLLSTFHDLMREAELDTADMLDDVCHGYCVKDARAVGMALPESDFFLLDLDLDYGDGAKTGQIRLALMPATGQRQSAGAAEAWNQQLQKAVSCAEVRMDAVLARKRMALGEVSQLRPGSLITLPGQVIENVRLCDMTGREVNKGVLGQANGFRAVMLTGRICDQDAEPPVMDLPVMDASDPAPPDPAPPALDPAGIGSAPAPENPDLPDLAAPDLAAPGDAPAGLAGGDPPDPVPDLPGMAGQGGGAPPPELPGSPDLPDLPDLPDMQTLPGADQAEFPDLSDLPDLSSL